MKTFFRPASIAVIGASVRDDSLGGQIITNLLYGYKEPIYPVNPNYKEIKGLRCYSTVDAIPALVDLAIVIVPAPAVPEALAACSRKGIGRVIIESAGFSETGLEGKALQDKCTAIARKAGIRLRRGDPEAVAAGGAAALPEKIFGRRALFFLAVVVEESEGAGPP